mmetsp:Transcript_1651/g.10149  ORF Transcript_1651/g.10149 Transcript_1651/m.10149 type:complete len:102 (+) Transcript_1651:2440-2745(+)
MQISNASATSRIYLRPLHSEHLADAYDPCDREDASPNLLQQSQCRGRAPQACDESPLSEGLYFVPQRSRERTTDEPLESCNNFTRLLVEPTRLHLLLVRRT